METAVAENDDFSTEEEYLTFLEESDRNIEFIDGEVFETTEKTGPSEVFSLTNQAVTQTIFDTKFTGLAKVPGRAIRDEAVLTRVEDSVNGFILDEPDTNNENITIEAYK